LGLKGFHKHRGRTFPAQIWAHPKCCSVTFETPNINLNIENSSDNRKMLLSRKCELCAVNFFVDTENEPNQDKLYIHIQIGYVRRLFCLNCFKGHLLKEK